MNEFISLCVAITALWVVITGIAYMIGGPAAARAVFVRPVRWAVPQLVRLVRRVVGGTLIALGHAAVHIGQWIRG